MKNNAEKSSKQEYAYRHIKQAIITNRFGPGTPLTERILCEETGISRTPVREALRRLAAEYMVEFYPDRGMFVAPVSAKGIREIYEVKESLESMAARLCVANGDENLLARMGQTIVNFEQAFLRGDYEQATDEDLAFHIALAEGANNTILLRMSQSLLDRTRRLSQLAVLDNSQTPEFIAQHRAIYESISRGNPEMADRQVREHIRSIVAFQIPRIDLFY